jgi:alpha-N-arabinofuranosidase
MPRLDAVAARDTGGRLWLAVTNLDPENPAEIAAEVGGVRIRSASGELLTAARVDAVNGFDAPNAVAPKPAAATVRDGRVAMTLPPASVAVVLLNPQGSQN